jgi:hypothetical protein
MIGFQDAKAQIVTEVFGTSQYAANEIWANGLFEDGSKFSFFNYTRFRINYSNQVNNQVLSYSTINYEIGKGFGLATGGFVFNNKFVPVLAANYFYQNDTWLINIFPSVELNKNANIEMFLFVQYRQKLTDKLRLFTQLIANSNFNFKKHNFSEQSLRVGLDYKKFQFGLGSDLSVIPMPGKADFQQNLGLFIRKEF